MITLGGGSGSGSGLVAGAEPIDEQMQEYNVYILTVQILMFTLRSLFFAVN